MKPRPPIRKESGALTGYGRPKKKTPARFQPRNRVPSAGLE